MSGLGLGGGDAWAKDHDKILKHAEGLKYPEWLAANNQGALPAADAPKQEWISAMDKFNAWKAGEVAKQGSGQAWWQTYPASQARPAPEGGGGGGGGSSSSSGLLPIGPYPGENVYFPMLTSRYERPQAYDLPDYMGATANLGAYMPANPFMGDGGLLYQPGTEQYADAYPINTGILEYQPPQFAVGPVQFYGAPFGPIEVTPPEELFGNEEEEEDDSESKGGKGPGDVPGAATASTSTSGTAVGSTAASVGQNSDIRLKKNIKFLGKSNTLDISKLRSNSI
jgi:hypothetical protein